MDDVLEPSPPATGAELESVAGGAGGGRAVRMASTCVCFLVNDCGVAVPVMGTGRPMDMVEIERDKAGAAPNSGRRGRAVALDETESVLCADVDLPRSLADRSSVVGSDLTVVLLRIMEDAGVTLATAGPVDMAKVGTVFDRGSALAADEAVDFVSDSLFLGLNMPSCCARPRPFDELGRNPYAAKLTILQTRSSLPFRGSS
jgi:hypothetical protein